MQLPSAILSAANLSSTADGLKNLQGQQADVHVEGRGEEDICAGRLIICVRTTLIRTAFLTKLITAPLRRASTCHWTFCHLTFLGCLKVHCKQTYELLYLPNDLYYCPSSSENYTALLHSTTLSCPPTPPSL